MVLALIEIERKDNYAIVKLGRKPVNSLNYELVKQLHEAINILEADKAIKGFILTSSIPNIFSAGFDITEMYNTTEQKYIEYWTSICHMWRKLYTTRLITIAAISGACPAAGALLSMSCDYRIMVKGNYRIGLNETLLGIVAPPWFIDLYVDTIGKRKAELYLQLGTMLTTDQALQVGLVDELADSIDDLMKRSQQEMNKWIKGPEQNARIATKVCIIHTTQSTTSNTF
jgi:3,2-trans-enoyl-CoA isomerase